MATFPNLESLVLFSHLTFIPKGTVYTVPGAGTVKQEVWPGAADPIWDDEEVKLGVCENVKEAPNVSTAMVKTGLPGGLRDKDEHEVGAELKFTADLVEVPARMAGLGRGAYVAANVGKLADSATEEYSPLYGKFLTKGILSVSKYDNENVLREVANLWVSLKVTNREADSGGNIVKITIEARVLASSLNTIAANAAA